MQNDDLYVKAWKKALPGSGRVEVSILRPQGSLRLASTIIMCTTVSYQRVAPAASECLQSKAEWEQG